MKSHNIVWAVCGYLFRNKAVEYFYRNNVLWTLLKFHANLL